MVETDPVMRGGGALAIPGRAGAPTGMRRRTEPRSVRPARELKRPGMTLAIGEIPRDASRRPLLQSILRFAARLRAAADAGDAPASFRQRQGVRGLFRQADRDRRSGNRRDPRGRDFRRRALARRTSPMPRRPGRRAYRTGSARMSGGSASSAARRRSWFPTFSRAASTRCRSR